MTHDVDRLRQVRRLTQVSRAITYAASPDEVFRITCERALELVSAEQVLLLVAGDDGMLVVRASCGVEQAQARGFREPLDEGLLPRLAGLLGAPPAGFLGVPLVVGGAVVGVVVAIRKAAGSDDDEWLLSALADQAAFALEKTHLEDVGQFREQLVGIVSHDLRNPLNTILVASQFLVQREGLGEKETALTRKIVRSANRAVKLIEQLLDLTRSRLGGGIPIVPRPTDLEEVARQVVGETELMHPERVLRMTADGDLAGVWDSDRMAQVLSNLIGNAVQHGEAGTPIDLRLQGGDTGVTIAVSNHGPPIPAAVLPVIFDAFRQGRTPSRSHGLGLGLFIAQQIVHAHGGTIGVTSTENEGTTVRLHLPRDAAGAPRA